MNSEKLEVATGSKDDFYIAKPASGTGKGVLVVHAWWGLNPFFRGFCDRLSHEGFVALAPDLYSGQTASTVQEAEKLRSGLKPDVVSQTLIRSADCLRDISNQTKHGIGIIGFSMGAWWALGQVEQNVIPSEATVVFYSIRSGNYSKTRSAFQFHLAESDDSVPGSSIAKVQENLASEGKKAEFYTYPGTSHWFFESDRRASYNSNASNLAWNRTIEFLNKHIK